MGLYKAKRIDIGEWVKGNLILLDDAVEDFRAIIIPREGSNCLSNSTEDYVKFVTFYKVDIDTVCRYTEHNDFEGTEIFENDIIRLYDMTEEDYIVRWSNGTFVLCDINSGTEHLSLVEDLINEGSLAGLRATVVGNCFNNTENKNTQLSQDAYVSVFFGENNPLLMPLVDYLDIVAGKYGFNSYEELKQAGYSIEIPTLLNKDGKPITNKEKKV